MVGTTNRPIAAIPSAWLRRNVFQPCDGGPLLRTIYLATLVCPTSIPSLSSSPWIRGAPHNELAKLISRIICRISAGTAGRPRRRLDFQRQNNRKPARCHRTTVSGRTLASASQAFGNRWQTQPRTTLSTVKNDSRLGLPRRSTMICCRKTRISASNAARGRIRSTTIQKIILQRSNIPQRIIRFCVSRQLHGIYDRDSDCSVAAGRAGATSWTDAPDLHADGISQGRPGRKSLGRCVPGGAPEDRLDRGPQ